MTLRHACIVLTLLFFPWNSSAGVQISEIAWMGTDVSATNEWIELLNDTDQSVTLDGWILKAIDGSPSIILSGTITPQAYFLIERTDDDSVPGVPADLITTFGKGLSNEGETLQLIDGSGAFVDTVLGEVNWKNIGGDAKTKFTAQKRGGVWVTAKATPRTAPVALIVNPVTPPPPKNEVVIQPLAPAPPPQLHVPEKERTPTATPHASPTPPLLVKIYGEEEVREEQKTVPQEATLPLLGTLILLGSSMVLYIRHKTKTEAEKYEIIEEETEE